MVWLFSFETSFSSCFILTSSIFMILYRLNTLEYSIKFHWLPDSKLFSCYIPILEFSWFTLWNWLTAVFYLYFPASWSNQVHWNRHLSWYGKKCWVWLTFRLELKQKQVPLTTPQSTLILFTLPSKGLRFLPHLLYHVGYSFRFPDTMS